MNFFCGAGRSYGAQGASQNFYGVNRLGNVYVYHWAGGSTGGWGGPYLVNEERGGPLAAQALFSSDICTWNVIWLIYGLVGTPAGSRNGLIWGWARTLVGRALSCYPELGLGGAVGLRGLPRKKCARTPIVYTTSANIRYFGVTLISKFHFANWRHGF